MRWDNIEGKDIIEWVIKLLTNFVIPIIIFIWGKKKADGLKKKDNELEIKQKESKDEINKELGEINKNLLQEVEKRVRLEEEMKQWKMLNSWNKRDKDAYYKEKEELGNKYWQLRTILSRFDFKQEEIDSIIDGKFSVLEWEKDPEMKRKRKEIDDKRFKWSNKEK